jgi:hypothetical protein
VNARRLMAAITTAVVAMTCATALAAEPPPAEAPPPVIEPPPDAPPAVELPPGEAPPPAVEPAPVPAPVNQPPPVAAPAPAAAPPPVAAPDPLARDYVDIGIRGGLAWRGNTADSRYSPFGWGLGMTIDFGRAPFWGGIYADIAVFGARAGVVDPKVMDPPSVTAVSAGWRAKVAIRLAPRLYLFPALGAGFGREEYASGHYVRSDFRRVCICNDAIFDGFNATGEATFAYVWRFGAVSFQPLRVTGFMFMHNRSAANPPGYDYGISRNGVLLAATIGVSVDPAAMVLAVWDAAKSLIPHGAP